jgi:hypothetical protein
MCFFKATIVSVNFAKKRARQKAGPRVGEVTGLPVLSGSVAGVQQLVSLMASGFAQVLFIEFDNIRVFMRLAHRHVGIRIINSGFTFFKDVAFAMNIRLTATVQAATGACHDFDRVVFNFAFLDALKNTAGVAKT